MNHIREATERLKNGWCISDLTQVGQKYCAVGALGASMLGEPQNLYDPNATDDVELEEYARWETKVYATVDSSEEASVLAETIRELHPTFNTQGRRNSKILYTFNDRQKSPEPVIELFEKAAAKWDETHS